VYLGLPHYWFQPSAAELQQIVAILAEQGKTDGVNVSKAFADGIHVAGERYVATRIEEQHIYARQVPLSPFLPQHTCAPTKDRNTSHQDT
jgi:hypothetical protein